MFDNIPANKKQGLTDLLFKMNYIADKKLLTGFPNLSTTPSVPNYKSF